MTITLLYEYNNFYLESSETEVEKEIVYSNITGERMPPCKCTRTREPNLDLMAKAIIDLYFRTKGQKLRER